MLKFSICKYGTSVFETRLDATDSVSHAYWQQNTLQPSGNPEAPPTNESSLQPSQAASMTALNSSPSNNPNSIGRKELPMVTFKLDSKHLK